MKRIPPHIAIMALILVLLVGFGIRVFLDPVPQGKLDQLRKGMSKEEVRQILGSPTRDYGYQWTYERTFVFGYINIHWLEDETYDGKFNYERF